VTDDRPTVRDSGRASGGPAEQLPPQDLNAERSVLGAMLLSKDAIADVVEIMKPEYFYRPAHQTIYLAVLELYGQGEPADFITVADELQKGGNLDRVGGAAYVTGLTRDLPSAVNASYHAEIVRQRSVLRRLIEAGTRIVQAGYEGAGEADDILNRAQAEIFEISSGRKGEDYVPLAAILEGAIAEIEAIANRDGDMVGVPTGLRDLDQLTQGLHPGQLVIIAARPAIGKSTLGLDIARAAAIKHGLTSVIFSLEMSRNEIMMRLLSAEGSIQLNNIRSGRMSSADWQKVAHRQDALRDGPLFIDDSPNMTMTEIRAKCRRLKQQHDLRLVIVDYMQLMTSGKKVESRQQEVSEFSRALKLLAKELEVPVIAISQLNRGPEQRTDKKPMLADLRESGCLTADTRVLRADTGAEATLGELLAAGARDVPVWALDQGLRYRARTLTRVFPTGRREVFEVRLATGRVVRATANHPLLTVAGWQPVGALAPGAGVAVPRHVPPPLDPVPLDEDEVVLAAHLLLTGLREPRQPVAVRSLSMDVLEAVSAAAWRRFGVRTVWDDERCALRMPAPCRLTDGVRNPVAAWLDTLGLYGAPDAGVPAVLWRAPKEQVALFLRHVWAACGAIGPGAVAAALPTRRLADDVARLLLRFGLLATVGDDGGVQLPAAADRAVFLRRIGGFGPTAAGAAAAARAADPAGMAAAAAPGGIWTQVGAAISTAAAGSGEPTGEGTSTVAALLADADLELVATNDVYWDEVVSITPLGPQEVYDATVPGSHNFIADGVVVHNSLEQDADVVVLIHREDFYDKENRPGEADLIVAKHRNGPTDTIAVSFQGHYSRFVDLAG
jgi:replicative DNA helicase